MLKRMYRKDEGVKNKDLSICMFKLAVHDYSQNKTMQDSNAKKHSKWWNQ